MARKRDTIDEYLAALSDDKRVALEKLRKTFRTVAPKVMSSSTVAARKDEIMDCDTSKGTIRFQADNPLPVALVRKLVKARIA